jgi:hypothetical protein
LWRFGGVQEYFVSTLTSAKKGHLQERIAQPFVQHRDTMAHVWCRSAFPLCCPFAPARYSQLRGAIADHRHIYSRCPYCANMKQARFAAA